MADEYSGKVIDALEMPYKGLLGLGRLGGGLLAGEGIDAAIDSLREADKAAYRQDR